MTGYSIVRADDVEDAYAGTDVPGELRSLKVAQTIRSHRNEGDEPVEIWAVSRKTDEQDAKVDDFWDASPPAG